MAIYELRQYTLHPGRRDELIELFEREFVAPQEALGMPIIGTFRDVGDPDRFVWIRGFSDMAARLAGLRAFYGGPVWQRHRDAANATMIDSDDVLLLEPVAGEFAAAQSGRLFAVVFPVDGARNPDDAEVVLRTTEHVNDFPALPVRDVAAEVRFLHLPDGALPSARGALQVLELEPTAGSRYR